MNEMEENIRDRVEVVIFNEKNEVMIVENRFPDNVYKCFPGGGKEGFSWDYAVEIEALEEAGVQIKNIHWLDTTSEFKGYSTGDPDKKWREEVYTGSRTRFCTAIKKCKDTSIFGNDGDGCQYYWMDIASAIAEFSGDNEFDKTRHAVLMEIKNKMSNKQIFNNMFYDIFSDIFGVKK